MELPALPKLLRYDHETRSRLPFDLRGLGDDIAQVIFDMEAEALTIGHKEFHGQLLDTAGFDDETGLYYGVLTGGNPEGASPDKAIVLCGALGIPLEEMLPIAEFIRRISNKIGLTDAEGRPLGVIVTGTPDYNFEKRLTKPERQSIRLGQHDVIGQKHLQLVNNLMPRQPGDPPVESLLIGYSFGNITAVSMAEQAPDFDMYVNTLIMGATPNVAHCRSRRELLASFALEGMRGRYPRGTPKVFTYGSDSALKYWSGVIRSASFYYMDVLAGVSSRAATTAVAVGHRSNVRNGRHMQVNIGGGTRDKVSPYVSTIAMVNHLNPVVGRDLEAVFAVDAPHAWARLPRLMGTMVGYALERTLDKPIRPPAISVVREPNPYV